MQVLFDTVEVVLSLSDKQISSQGNKPGMQTNSFTKLTATMDSGSHELRTVCRCS